MTDDNSDKRLTRRNALRIAGAAGAASLAGCGGDGGDGSSDGSDGSGSGDGGGDTTTATSTLEVAHWWGEGDGNAAINALFEGFKEKYPNVSTDDNLVAGGAGSNLRTNIRTRIQNGSHPSTWQAWPGKNLIPFTDADLLEDIEDSVWSKNGMKDAYLPGVKDAAQPAGNYVTVPLNIHRINNLFYNVSVVEDAGVDPTSLETPSDVTDALKAVSDAGYTGMAHQTGSAWSTVQMFATIFLGQTDAETYNATWVEGNIEANRDAIASALDVVREYSEFYPSDSGSISWTEANSGVINGETAFLHQGDWAAGTYVGTDGFKYKEDWDYVPFPGTSGNYMLNMDSFPYPTANPSPEATTKWCRYCGTTEGQERFNPKKGSIPPRTDASTEPFSAFSQDQIKDFTDSDAQPPSLQHGLAVKPSVKTGVSSAFSSFITGSANDKVISQLKDAYSNL
ncbi:MULTISPECIES: ABC transporter substrate-binding protein [Haloarcula]|uniref:Sugar ABC transporter substrate-binding protein n=1 Tax=Haloarcula pellucida TaxID=1427151 RepID=A0A830GIM0_9EURY|nr:MULTISPECIES: ABC transporter substrate-binding protein [Halomicroarcula]MBX0347484.1 ABC transporter substrate-binding protein [Halomicroarcula pellucida]MDS0276641.1 ABC transporter substrate-binding protein [Halomicroarcula sp. S1AR25-4]GGN88887.1 sugar ABC transporter substrate-binding protein [Halomicroarcula pellucida]